MLQLSPLEIRLFAKVIHPRYIRLVALLTTKLIVAKRFTAFASRCRSHQVARYDCIIQFTSSWNHPISGLVEYNLSYNGNH